MSERTIMGTARYVGMGGAMSAIGGDPSAVHDNVAGLGLYRRSELLLTLNYTYDRTNQIGTTDYSGRHNFMLPQASLVLSLPSNALDDNGLQYNNFILSFHRLHSFNRNMYGASEGEPSLGALLKGTDVNWDIPFCAERYSATDYLNLQESGYVDEFGIEWAMNLSNQLYLGAGLRIQSYSLTSDAVYHETFAKENEKGVKYMNRNATTTIFSGTSCNLSAGVIYRPTGWLRLGMGLQTHSLGALNSYTAGTLSAQTDSLRFSYAPDCSSRDADFHMPLHLSSSLAFQIGAYGLIAFQYDYLHQFKQNAVHSLRAGIEVIPVLGLYINAGYAYESTFNNEELIVPMDYSFNRQDTYFQQPKWSQYASLAVGYRGTYAVVQAAYQYRWQQLNLTAHEKTAPFDMHADTHRIVLTIGWHRN